MVFKLETQKQQRTTIRSVVETLIYSSFGAPLFLLWSPYGESEDARYIHGGFSEPSRRKIATAVSSITKTPHCSTMPPATIKRT